MFLESIEYYKYSGSMDREEQLCLEISFSQITHVYRFVKSVLFQRNHSSIQLCWVITVINGSKKVYLLL